MKITTSRFGEIDIDESRIITFTEGILGFPLYKKYVLLDHEKNTPFRWLQAVERDDLAFVLIDPLDIDPGYRAEVTKEDIEDLKIASFENVVVLCIVNIGKGGSSVTVNMVGPIVINLETMLARQIILMSSPYDIKHDLLTSAKPKTAAAAK